MFSHLVALVVVSKILEGHQLAQFAPQFRLLRRPKRRALRFPVCSRPAGDATDRQCGTCVNPAEMIDFILLISRQGKVRLSKWYSTIPTKDKARITREVSSLVLNRAAKMCNFLEWKDKKVVYKRYASLYFVMAIGKDDNELITLEMIHAYVEVLDRYFGNVCELDIIFNFHKAYHILDEMFIGGEMQETNKKEVMKVTQAQDDMCRAEEEGNPLGVPLAGATLAAVSGRR